METPKNVREEIMRVMVEACDCSVKEMHCDTANEAIKEVCNDIFDGSWKRLIQFAMENMSMEQFMKIKEISLGEDYPAYASKYKFCKCENK